MPKEEPLYIRYKKRVEAAKISIDENKPIVEKKIEEQIKAEVGCVGADCKKKKKKGCGCGKEKKSK